MSEGITLAADRKTLGSFTLAMIAVVAVIDLRSSAMMATFGLSAVFYFLMTALLYFIPFGFGVRGISHHSA